MLPITSPLVVLMSVTKYCIIDLLKRILVVVPKALQLAKGKRTNFYPDVGSYKRVQAR